MKPTIKKNEWRAILADKKGIRENRQFLRKELKRKKRPSKCTLKITCLCFQKIVSYCIIFIHKL